MIYPFVFALGAVIGWRRAARRGGDRLDQLHYAGVHGIVLTLAAVLLAVLAGQFGLF